MYSAQVASNTGTLLGVNHACCAIPLYGPDTCAFVASQFSSPTANPVGVPPAPSAVRCGGAPDARSSTRVFAQGQPLCWARCPCVVIPLWVIPHVYSSTVRLPSRWARVFPGRDLLPSLLCSYLTPGWLSLPQSLPYVILPLASPYVFSTWYLLYAGCGFRSVPLLGVRFPSVIHTHCTEQQCRSSLPKSCPIFRPNWCGGTCRLPQGTGGGQQ